jgi:N-methylhydantoinase A
LDLLKLKNTVAELDRRAAELMAMEQIESPDITITYSADVSFVGQSYTIEIPLHPNDPDAASLLHDNFLRAHDRVYGHAVDGEIKIVNVRAVHRASPRSTPNPIERPSSFARPDTLARKITVAEGAFVAQVYNRSDLTPGTILSVPAVVQQPDTTTVIDRGWSACVDPAHNLILSRLP